MRVLVTGAAGFIGQHVCRLLREQGHDVIAIDNRPSPGGRLDCEIDITQPVPTFSELDAVIHLAAIASPRVCDQDPAKAWLVNVQGTWNVLEMARLSHVSRFVFPSSAHVYGIPALAVPTDETCPVYTQSCYTTTKIMGEDLCRHYCDAYGLSCVRLRLFNTYGPGQSLGYFIPDMVEQARQGRIKFSGALTTKDFVYIDDVARAFVQALEPNRSGAYNIGSGQETTLHRVAQQIAAHFGVPMHSYDDGKATRMCADRSMAKSFLHWEPKVSLEEGLNAVCEAATQPVSP